ncbi:hypothetical protein ACH5RR_016771 [Cinchona calisaya]|uniref:Glucan endo-1,3-beta-D-glucosidase n=1 Tax=Cinchona calisaya TaxID=153742 RepID=A0ABD3A0J1_9GENT
MTFSFNILALTFLSLLTTTAITSSTTTIGVTYKPSSSPNLPTPEHVASTLQSLHIPAVHLLHPTPASIRAFAYSNISLLLTIPNSFISSFAANRSSSTDWLYNHVLPFYPRARISLISVGNDVVSSSELDPTNSDPSTVLLPAMRNLNLSLGDLGIKNIRVSTTFSFIKVMEQLFPPSTAGFLEPIDKVIIKPVLQFLDDNNSSFLIDVVPYDVYKLHSEIPIGFALFQENPFNFRDDGNTAVRYRNLFDMMVDGVVASLANSGHQNIRIIVTRTGWPSSSSISGYVEAEASQLFAEMYLKGLIAHMKSGMGTPLRKDGVAEVYIYELFDEEDDNNPNSSSSVMSARNGSRSDKTGEHQWGILYPNMTMKFDLDFSGSEKASGIKFAGWVGLFLWIFGEIVFWLL